MAKLGKRSTKSQLVKNKTEMILREDCTHPGQRLHTDQYDSSVGGGRLNAYGKKKPIDKLRGGTIL